MKVDAIAFVIYFFFFEELNRLRSCIIDYSGGKHHISALGFLHLLLRSIFLILF